MQPAETLRNWHLDQLRKAIPTLKYVLERASDAELKTIRDGGNGWTPAEVLGHLKDFEHVFVRRAHMTMEQEMAALPFPDHEALVVQGKFNDIDVWPVYEEWAATRRSLIALFEGISDEALWEKPAAHPKRGPFTLNDQLFLTVWHDMNHIEQMIHTLQGFYAK
jgi:uncharacterized damage-inducible protein DinB